jgi:hypothetical protein
LSKIIVRKIKKKYNDKVYNYEQYAVILSLKTNKELSSWIGRQLDVDVRNDALVITPRKPEDDGEIIN